MKFSNILPLAALGSALVLPSEDVLGQLTIEKNHRGGRLASLLDEATEVKDNVVSNLEHQAEEVAHESQEWWQKFSESSKAALDDAFDEASEEVSTIYDKAHDAAFDMQSWLSAGAENLYEEFDEHHHGPPPPPHHGPPPPHHGPAPPHHGPPPPHHGPPPPHHGPPPHGPPNHKRPGCHPKHPPHHHHEPNLTVYQLISESKYTTKLAKLINKYDDLVEALNMTSANFTVFAPTDKAFEKIPEHAPKPTKEQLKALLSYHVVPGVYSARDVLSTHTVPTLYKSPGLGKDPLPQRLAFKIGLRGLTVNFHSRIVAVNIFATNGVIHGVDSLIIPPPSTLKIIDLLPTEFSTLELGLGKTGLLEQLNSTKHAGGTFFAPSNWAFTKLGPRINAFLFSTYGQKYLKALLEYHVVPLNTLYSDAFYKAGSEESTEAGERGFFHVDLPTLLKDRSLSIDIARFGGYINLKINGFSSVSVQDGIAEDGVIHVVSSVLIPPKKVGGEMVEYNGEQLDVEDLMERLEPFVTKGDL